MSAPVRLTFITRHGCHLCDHARAVVASVAAEAGIGWVERDVDADGLDDDYGDRVPVVLLDGREHAYWRVDAERLRAALAGRQMW